MSSTGHYFLVNFFTSNARKDSIIELAKKTSVFQVSASFCEERRKLCKELNGANSNRNGSFSRHWRKSNHLSIFAHEWFPFAFYSTFNRIKLFFIFSIFLSWHPVNFSNSFNVVIAMATHSISTLQHQANVCKWNQDSTWNKCPLLKLNFFLFTFLKDCNFLQRRKLVFNCFSWGTIIFQ